MKTKTAIKAGHLNGQHNQTVKEGEVLELTPMVGIPEATVKEWRVGLESALDHMRSVTVPSEKGRAALGTADLLIRGVLAQLPKE